MFSPVGSLARNVLGDFNNLTESQGKNIVAWSPVVAQILNGIKQFDDQAVGSLLS
jgi:brefeldin A-inhibited guanine nucleotide-exchange protein